MLSWVDAYGTLYGTWNIGTPSGVGSNLTGITAAQVGALSTNNIQAGPASSFTTTNAGVYYFTW